MSSIIVLYEDQRGERRDFGFHRFICQGVIDLAQLQSNVYEIERRLVHGIPLKGNGNVRRRCQGNLVNKARRLFAVYDQDKIARLLNLSGKPCRTTICQHLKKGCDAVDSLEIILIDQTIETIITAIRDAELTTISRSVFDDAIGKNQVMRDSVFNQCVELPFETRKKLYDLEALSDVSRLIGKICDTVISINES